MRKNGKPVDAADGATANEVAECLLRGNGFLESKDYKRAVEEFSKAIWLDSGNVKAYRYRGWCRHWQGRYDEAIKDFDEAIRLDPNNAPAFRGRGMSYHKQNHLYEAIKDYSEAIRLDPMDAAAYSGRYRIYGKTGQYKEAIADCFQSIRLNPDGNFPFAKGRNKDETILNAVEWLTGFLGFLGHLPKQEKAAFRRCVEIGAYSELKDVLDWEQRQEKKDEIAERASVRFDIDAALCVKALDILEVAIFSGSAQDAKSGAELPSGEKFLTEYGTQVEAEQRAAKLSAAFAERKDSALVRTFRGHGSSVMSVAFSPCGKYVVSGSWDKTLKLWEIKNGRLVRTFKEHESSVMSVAFSPCGKYVVSGSGKQTLKLWEAGSGELVRDCKGDAWSIVSVAYSPCGKYVVSGTDEGSVTLWDVENGSYARQFGMRNGEVRAVAYSPCGRYVVSGSMDTYHDGYKAYPVWSGPIDATLKLWDAKSGEPIHGFGGGMETVDCIAFSPCGKYIAVGSGKSVVLWEVESGKMYRFMKHGNSVNSVAFSPCGKYVVSTAYDATLKLWDAGNGALVREFKGHDEPVNCAAFSPCGKYIVSGADDDTLKLWEVWRPVQGRTFVQSYRKEKTMLDMVKMWIRDNGEEILFQPEEWKDAFAALARRLRKSGETEAVPCAETVERLVAALFGKSDTQELTQTGKSLHGVLVRTFNAYARIQTVAFSPCGKYVISGSSDETIKLWDAESGDLVRTFNRNTGEVRTVAFSPCGKYVVSGSWFDKTMKLWNVRSGALVREFRGHDSWAHSVAFSPSGKYIVSGLHRTLKLLDVGSGDLVRDFEGHKRALWSVAFSPCGNYVISGSMDKTMKLWEIESGALVRSFDGHEYGVWSVAFSPCGKYVVSGSEDQTIKLWDVENGGLIRSIEEGVSYEWSVVFSPCGKYILSGSFDSTVKLRDVQSGLLVRVFEGHIARVNSVAFSPSGKYIVSGSDDCTLKLWEI